MTTNVKVLTKVKNKLFIFTFVSTHTHIYIIGLVNSMSNRIAQLHYNLPDLARGWKCEQINSCHLISYIGISHNLTFTQEPI